jgi:hypothetical protein
VPPTVPLLPGARVTRLGAGELDRLDYVRLPHRLPPGYAAAEPSAAVLYRSRTVPTAVVYYRRSQTEFGTYGIRITQRPARSLPPSSESFVAVGLGDTRARWSAERAELEWVDDGVYRAVAVPSFNLATALQIARSMT